MLLFSPGPLTGSVVVSFLERNGRLVAVSSKEKLEKSRLDWKIKQNYACFISCCWVHALGWGSARPPVALGLKAGLGEGNATISQWKPNFETAAGKQIRVGNVQLLGFLMKNTGLQGGKGGYGHPGHVQSSTHSSIRNITTTFLQDPKAIRIPPDTGGGMQYL